MARRRSVSLASVLVNPRKRKGSSKRKSSKRVRVKAHSRGRASSRKRKNPSRSRKARRSAPRVARINGRKARVVRRKNGRFARKSKSFARRNGRKSFARRGARKNGRFARKTKSFRRNGYRRNGALLGGIAATFAKLPLIGGPLASMIAALPLGALAGVTVEVPIQASAWLGDKDWVPSFIKDNEFVYFTLLGGITGGVLGSIAKMANIKAVQPAQIAALCTAAGAGAGYAKMRTRQIANEAGIATPEQQASGSETEATKGLGALVSASTAGLGAIATDMGMGPAYAVGPQGYSGMGAISVATL